MSILARSATNLGAKSTAPLRGLVAMAVWCVESLANIDILASPFSCQPPHRDTNRGSRGNCHYAPRSAHIGFRHAGHRYARACVAGRPIKGLVCVAVALFGLALASSHAAAQHRAPFEIVRSMQALQDQIALGNTSALAALPGLSNQLAEKLLAADPAVWRETRNARAAITYVLSGGQPRVLRKILAGNEYPSDDKKLMEGALAYVEGQEAKAKELLGSVDPRSLEAIVGGHVALAQATLFAHDDPHKAIALLDTARVLAPGTLVEEAALRREVFLSEQIDDFNKFSASAAQYLRRFGNSSYAANFESRFSASLISIAVAGKIEQITMLEPLMSDMSETSRLRLYLAIAQSALVNGKLDTAKYAAAKAVQFAKPGTVEANRAVLYHGASAVLTRPLEENLDKLETLDRSMLTRRDLDLADAVTAIDKEIHNWPETRRSGRDPQGPTLKPPPGFEPAIASADATLARARDDLAATDDVLKEKSP
jgi:chemotaxis protein MotC